MAPATVVRHDGTTHSPHVESMRIGKEVGWPLIGSAFGLLIYAYFTAELPSQRAYVNGQVAYYEPQRGGEWDEYLTLVVRSADGFERFQDPAFVRRAYPLNTMAPQGKNVRVGYDKWAFGMGANTRRLVELEVEGRPVIGRWRLMLAEQNNLHAGKFAVLPLALFILALVRIWNPTFGEQDTTLVGEEPNAVRGLFSRHTPHDRPAANKSRRTPKT